MEINISDFTSNNFILNIALAITIFTIGLILGKIVGKAVKRLIRDSGLEQLIKQNTKLKVEISSLIGVILSYIIYFFSFVWALDILGIASTILNLFSGAVLIIIIILVFLGFKDFIPNITAGMFIHTKGIISTGDKIKHHDIEGVVEEAGFIETVIKTKNGDFIFIPNTRLTQYELIKKNYKRKKS